ncbi:DUF4357 domain-containing protein [Emticicia sp. C21]|uniref:DUF4357 domain-containing protein n=1 Tax=Emticicia sp. C21 TaxID=2302915 RepID=UPI0018F41B49|nr:DUF4357 domain-containing protein [Emticicia sp. C21]
MRIADRYKLENSNAPVLNSLPLPDRDAMEDFVIYIKLLNGTLGHKFLEDPIPKSDFKDINNLPQVSGFSTVTENLKLELKIKEIYAKAIQTDEGIVVLKSSEVSISESKNYNYSALREKLISEKVIISNQLNKLYFVEDYLFKSASAAAAVIMGYSINGRDAWKDKNGKSLNEIERLKVESASLINSEIG